MPTVRSKARKRTLKEGRVAPPSSISRPISMTQLQWKPVSIPAMALASDSRSSSFKSKGKENPEEAAGDGSEDEGRDPFAGLDEGADDFMGLQEVTSVGIRFEGDVKTGRRVTFYQKGDKIAAAEGAFAMTVSSKNSKKLSSKGQKSIKRAKASQSEEEAAGPAQQIQLPKFDGRSGHKMDKAAFSMPRPHQSHHRGSSVDTSMPVQVKAHITDAALGPSAREEDAIPEGIFSAFAADMDNAEASREPEDLQLSEQNFDDRALPGWSPQLLQLLHPLLKRALRNLSFVKPTPIQSRSLPHTLPQLSASGSKSKARDLVALAQTGSGKTLAYALPILQKILVSRSSIFDVDESGRPLQALVVLPTRELALQVYNVFQKIVAASILPDDDSDSKALHKPWVQAALVVGGMSEERQWRLLRGRKAKQNEGGDDAEVIVATVGRLWELCKSDDYLPSRLKDARTLVLDEADRLLENGKFQELSSILELLKSPQKHTMMFSATLDPTLQVNMTKNGNKVAKMLKQDKGGTDLLMAKLMDQVGFKSPDGVDLIDLTQEAKVSENLKEGKVQCLGNEKDLYLYYLLLRYPGSFLVFLNSIDSVRRLQPLLSNLGVNCFGLHGEMNQRARLRALDGFKLSFGADSSQSKHTPRRKEAEAATQSSPTAASSVLLATDVAARGLDIPLVSYVVHFHLPRSADTYIHRSGRTARAGRSGLSLLLLSPDEKSRWTSLRRNMGRFEGPDIKDLPIMLGVLGRLKTRLKLAKELDEARHCGRKAKANMDWVKKLADEAEIALDDDGDVDPDADHVVNHGAKGKVAAAHLSAIRELEKQLAHELSKDLVVRGVKRKFITQGAGFGLQGEIGGGGDLLRDLVSGAGHNTFLGLPKTQAASDLDAGKPKASDKVKLAP